MLTDFNEASGRPEATDAFATANSPTTDNQHTDTMSISVPQHVFDAIVRAQERARRRFAAAYEPYDQDDLAIVNLGDDDAPFVVAVRNLSVYEWDEETERVGNYLGLLEAAAEPEPEPEPQAPEEYTVMPDAEAADGWDKWDEVKVD